MDSGNLLGDFLRARREALGPFRAGGAHTTTRRGREEVAMLAGVSTDFYVRLEEGTQRPSERVLDSLVRVLDLNPGATRRLWEVARPLLPVPPEPRGREQADQRLQRLIDTWYEVPVLCCDQLMNVRAANDLGAALLDGLQHADNLFKLAFMDPAATDFFTEWPHIAGAAADRLHSIELRADHTDLAALVAELSEASSDFRRMWAGHDLSSDAHRVKRLRHPEVGRLTLFCEVLDVARLPGHSLLVLQPEPGSPSEGALALLGSLVATQG
ncbi:helix-turn-helix domain-containing protein [Planotetraspora kaengkrachanensis]|uniref:Transcriptional regulator n=1 Tax=Planotetraspora kaengkrachanensis TaxID=575193 RepID=A0A8J3LQS6_9ACTN|nr:helix-turn-helix transcriptional regulator [Planotetraspora kaengkrachanensis]GIG77528.1 transcriptional regulator [Planotetraspora kaengkrachanensis]